MGLGNWLKNRGKSTKDYGEKVFNYKELKENSGHMKDMAKIILSPKDTIKNSHRETFQEAKARLNVSDMQLILNYRNYSYIVYISIGFTILCFFTALYYLFIEHSLLSAVATISMMAFCLVNAFKFSFRAFQIKHQKLCSVKEWWDRSEEWWPQINNNNNKKAITKK